MTKYPMSKEAPSSNGSLRGRWCGAAFWCLGFDYSLVLGCWRLVAFPILLLRLKVRQRNRRQIFALILAPPPNTLRPAFFKIAEMIIINARANKTRRRVGKRIAPQQRQHFR